MNEYITPQDLSVETRFMSLNEGEYDWKTQTRLYRDENGMLASTGFGSDTDTASHSGNDVFSDDSDTD